MANSAITESRCRIWHTLRFAARPLPLRVIARDAMLNPIEAEQKLEKFIKEGFIRSDGDKYYPVWDGRKPRNVTWEKF